MAQIKWARVTQKSQVHEHMLLLLLLLLSLYFLFLSEHWQIGQSTRSKITNATCISCNTPRIACSCRRR
jgi:hypothetical protein